MRLSDAGLRRRQTKLIYPDHRSPPWLTEDATRDRSNRLLDPSGVLAYHPRSKSFLGANPNSRNSRGQIICYVIASAETMCDFGKKSELFSE